MQDFVAAVKQDCVVAKFYFNFYYIPDLIMRQKYTRPQYQTILKVLNKVKRAYLDQKREKE